MVTVDPINVFLLVVLNLVREDFGFNLIEETDWLEHGTCPEATTTCGILGQFAP